jgi:CheY-like chemotaxis protein
MERLLARLLGDQIKLEIDLAPDLPSVDADPSQLEQVVMNLAVNAGDAMPSGGRLTIKTSAVTLDEAHRARHPGAEIGPHVLLLVRDGGTGIPAAVLPRIFEPFFTTKPRGRGTGLGLATVYGAVRQWNGHISVSSTPGAGTEFRIYLPVGSELVASVRPALPQRTTSLAGTDTVVLVDTDDLVRGLARRVLSSRGYRVIEARSRREALQALQTAASVDLLLTDASLGDGDGRELASLVTASRPGLRVLITSALMDGGPDEPAGGETPAGASYPVLSKPFTPVALLEKVRDVLQESSC